MFEKEAEEYGKRISKGLPVEKGSYTELALKSGILGFEHGAEFGYNKALEKEKTNLVQEKYNLEYKIENLENKVEHHQEVIDTLQKKLERNCTPEEICMKLEERIHTLEVYLEGAINFLILNGDVDNPIIKSVENILHITFNKNRR